MTDKTETTEETTETVEQTTDQTTETTSEETDQSTFKEDQKTETTDDTTDETEDTSNTDEDAELDTDVWGSTGDDVGDSVLQMLQNAGTTPETAKALLWDAVQAGDATKIDRDALVEAVGKTKATLIMAGMENYVGKISQRAAEVTKIVDDAVGGNDNWKAIRDWAKETLSADDMADYADLIDKGGRKAALAAKDLKEQYEEAGHTFKETTGITPSGKSKQPVIQPLSKSEYFAAVEKLHKEGKATPEATNQLWKARQLGIAQEQPK